MARGPAAGATAQVSFLVEKPRSFSLNLTTLVPLRQLELSLQDPGEAVVSRSHLWINLVLVHRTPGEPAA